MQMRAEQAAGPNAQERVGPRQRWARDRMKTRIILAALLLAGSAVAEEAERYTIQAYTVSVIDLAGDNKPVRSEDAIFKLDSQLGSVWRMDTNAFQRIPVRDLVSQKGFSEWQEKQFLKRLDAVKIPEIDFRQESFSNAVAFLQAQIKRLDPTIAAGSDAFLRLKYVGSDDSIPLITFTARDISALETLKILTQISNMKYRVEDDHIVITPWFGGGGPVTFHTYQVSPSLRERLHGTTISNVLSELGFDMKPWTRLKYSPELDIIVAGTTYSEHQRFQELLYLTDLARQWPGRFRLVSRQHAGSHRLFLLDGKTGQTWLYRATIGKNGKKAESFDLLQTTWYPEREECPVTGTGT